MEPEATTTGVVTLYSNTVVDSITIPTDEGVEPSPESVAEINRLKAASIDALETAAMYAVKAATYKR